MQNKKNEKKNLFVLCCRVLFILFNIKFIFNSCKNLNGVNQEKNVHVAQEQNLVGIILYTFLQEELKN